MNIKEVIGEVKKVSPRLAGEIERYVKNHSYGLVFERNLPDVVRLWNKEVERCDKVHILPPRGKLETEENTKIWYVADVDDTSVYLMDEEGIESIVNKEDVVPVVDYKDVIYPGLKVIDKVERGGKDDAYHMVINAENYHALQMLRYAYKGKVDCIYIDPPYNTGSKDWKYNNNYVGQDDEYRHSKWLTFMERRLKIARELLKDDSVMIVTIDEKEYLRLGMLLEQTFPDANIQMISSLINPTTVSRKGFGRTDEYIYIVMFGNVNVSALPLLEDWLEAFGKTTKNTIHWCNLSRTGTGNKRSDSPGCFYPIYVSNDGKRIVEIGDSLPLNMNRNVVTDKDGCIKIFPIHVDGSEGRWMMSSSKLREHVKNGYVKLGNFTETGMAISYLPKGQINKILSGDVSVLGKDVNGVVILDDSAFVSKYVPGTQWRIRSHDANRHGSNLLLKLMPDRKFPFPKSLYAVEDVIRFFVADKPNALIVDFFAGSGTTAHATMLLNHLDGGHRTCISVTNNEVGPNNEKNFIKEGLRPTDEKWQNQGIANYITWERVKAAITGIATNGEPIKGDYKFTEEFPMSEGFKENAIFCELTYEKKWDIELDNAFDAVAPILWAMAGGKGGIIKKRGKGYATTDNYGVLFKYSSLSKFAEAIKNKPEIKHIFVVSDDDQRYYDVVKKINWIDRSHIHRLYESYLRSFEIKAEGGLD